jgi:hypothetical protein
MFVIRVSIIVWMLALAHAACAGSSASHAKAEYADVLTKFRNQTFVTSYDVIWPTGRRLGQLTMAHDGGSSYIGLRSGGLQLDWYLTGNESIICQAASCRATPRVEASAAFLDLDEPTTPVGEIREMESAGATAGQCDLPPIFGPRIMRVRPGLDLPPFLVQLLRKSGGGSAWVYA